MWLNGQNPNQVWPQLKAELSVYSEVGQNSIFFLNDALELIIPYCKFSTNGYYFGTGKYCKPFSSTSM
jgi:hypothetical protein